MKIMILIAYVFLVGCATAIPSKQATLVSSAGDFHVGTLIYDGPYSGVLTFPGDSGRESFTGRFNVVDRTSIKKSSADVLIPSNNAIPAMGTSSSSETGEIDAEGYWFGQGDRGATLRCTLSIGINGHGVGKCSSSNGSSYDITL